MKKRYNVLKKMLKNNYDGFTFKNWFVYITILLGFVIPLFTKIGLYYFITIVVIALLLVIYVYYNNTRFLNDSDGNGVYFGGRGKGKGILLNKNINAQNKAFCNVPYGNNTEVIDIKEYVQSIGDNTILDTINNTVKVVNKIGKFEGVNVYVDDTTVYFPNFMDNVLKNEYPSLPLTLAVNRHLYNANMIITTQSLTRPYKILRELQTDFSMRALKTTGFKSWFYNSIPILRKFVIVSYRFYELPESAEKGILPFNAIGLLSKGLKHIHLGAGQATKEQFISVNGVIYNGKVIMLKSKLSYDTRYFHELFFGISAKEWEKENKH